MSGPVVGSYLHSLGAKSGADDTGMAGATGAVTVGAASSSIGLIAIMRIAVLAIGPIPAVPLARKGVHRIDPAIGVGAGRRGHALLIGRELAVSRIPP